MGKNLSDLDEADAPSPGAWGLLSRAQKDSQLAKWLYDRILPKSAFESGEQFEEPMLARTEIEDQMRKEFGDLVHLVTELCKAPPAVQEKAVKAAQKVLGREAAVV